MAYHDGDGDNALCYVLPVIEMAVMLVMAMLFTDLGSA
jgi:hypothetical protein